VIACAMCCCHILCSHSVPGAGVSELALVRCPQLTVGGVCALVRVLCAARPALARLDLSYRCDVCAVLGVMCVPACQRAQLHCKVSAHVDRRERVVAVDVVVVVAICARVGDVIADADTSQCEQHSYTRAE
jgi:hypothetical protein